MKEKGLYTDGHEVALVFDIWDTMVSVQVLAPVAQGWKFVDKQEATERYPTKIEGVFVEEGSEKAEQVELYGLYTDGKEVMFVTNEWGVADSLTCKEVWPCIYDPRPMFTKEYFLKKYPYKLDGVELD